MGLRLGGIPVELDPNVAVGVAVMHPETLAWFLKNFPQYCEFASDDSTQSRTGLTNGEPEEAVSGDS